MCGIPACKTRQGCCIRSCQIENLQTGSVVERKFNAGIKLQNAQVERKPMQYLYEADGSYCFMDTETYEQIMLNKDQLGDKINFLKEEMECTVMFFNGSIIGVDIPNSVELKVVETEPGIRGDTATGGSKPAKWKQDILFLYRSLSTKVKCSVLIHVQAHISNV